jgi:His/Glu/Gln/Arg/opine family amino acid ABC transporter permease subunit
MQVSFDVMTVFSVFWAELTVVPRTLGVALITVTVAIALGSALAQIGVKRIPVLGHFACVFVSYMRGTPMVVQLYLTYYGLPGVVVFFDKFFTTGINLHDVSPLLVVLIAYSLNAAAFLSENIRGALISVEKGQIEAAHSIGMTGFQTFFRVVAPQALFVVIPQFCNAYVSMIKMLSLAYMVSFVDIMAQAKLSAALNFRYIESYLAATIVYWILCGVLTFFFSKLEKRLSRGKAILSA